MKVVIYRRADGLWDWSAQVRGKPVATSHNQGFRKPWEARRSWRTFAQHIYWDDVTVVVER